MLGRVEIICGGMFSGKTEELLRRLRRTQFANQVAQVFTVAMDSRYGYGIVASHDGSKCEAIPLDRDNPGEILDLLNAETTVVGIDEAQFFAGGLVDVCEEIANRGVRVIAVGLNIDALARPFGPMPQLMARADHVTTLHAICVVCGADASRTQLLINGKPVPWQEGPLILVGGENEGYEARCRACHEVPGDPKN